MKQNNKKNGHLFVLSGPSGVGKTAVAKKVLKQDKNTHRVVTYSSRKIRTGEVNKKDYNFISENEFKKLINENHFLEWAQVHGNLYGTPRPEVEEFLDKGKNVLLVIDVQGGIAVKKQLPEAILIFLIPDDIKHLKYRIKRRRQNMSEKDLAIRLNNAIHEIKTAQTKYDILVTNYENQIDKTIEEISKIIQQV